MALQTSEDRFNGVLATLAIKAPCIAVQTTPLADLEGLLVVDGFQTVAGARVLVVSQTDPIENGIYCAQTSDWTRTPDFDGNRDITRGTIVNVDRSVGTSAVYEVITIPDPVIGVDAINFRLWYDSGAAAICAPVNPLGFTILNQSLGSVGGVLTIDYQLGQGITLNLTEDVINIIFSNICPGNVAQLEFDIRQDSLAWVITWPASIKWRSGTIPDITTVDSITQVHLRTTNGGGEWLGTFSENHA
jgi:hypothetical protein